MLSQEVKTSDLDVLEMFCGIGAASRKGVLRKRPQMHHLFWGHAYSVSKAIYAEARRRGYRARKMDIKISDTNDVSRPWGLLPRGIQDGVRVTSTDHVHCRVLV